MICYDMIFARLYYSKKQRYKIRRLCPLLCVKYFSFRLASTALYECVAFYLGGVESLKQLIPSTIIYISHNGLKIGSSFVLVGIEGDFYSLCIVGKWIFVDLLKNI